MPPSKRKVTLQIVVGTVCLCIAAGAYYALGESRARWNRAELALEKSVCAREFDLDAESRFVAAMEGEQDADKAAEMRRDLETRVRTSLLAPHVPVLKLVSEADDLQSRVERIAGQVVKRCPAVFSVPLRAEVPIRETLKIAVASGPRTP